MNGKQVVLILFTCIENIGKKYNWRDVIVCPKLRYILQSYEFQNSKKRSEGL